MNELIEALERLLERGIVVEPFAERGTASHVSFRIRLADVVDNPIEPVTTTDQSQATRSW